MLEAPVFLGRRYGQAGEVEAVPAEEEEGKEVASKGILRMEDVSIDLTGA